MQCALDCSPQLCGISSRGRPQAYNQPLSHNKHFPSSTLPGGTMFSCQLFSVRILGKCVLRVLHLLQMQPVAVHKISVQGQSTIAGKITGSETFTPVQQQRPLVQLASRLHNSSDLVSSVPPLTILLKNWREFSPPWPATPRTQ